MGKVHILPSEIASKIAAGEVIERPASVIKELIENALDAGAESIEVSLKRGGKTFICLKDNGTGIEGDDIEKIFKRHSTSKIHRLEDLSAITSLGFRGEALYSIAAIADVTLRSRTKSSDTGWEIHLRGGKKLNLQPVGMPEGTEVEVKELFFNTPARRKFLKSDTRELQQALNIFTPYTLLYPERRFHLSHYNRTIIHLPAEKTFLNRICKALNLKQKYLLETEHKSPSEEISIKLILGDINIQRPRKDMQFIFINNRPVQNYLLSFHLNQAYKLILPAEVYPFFAVYITLPAANVDVNIHPTKHQVKIKNDFTLLSLLRSMCEKTLLSHGKPKVLKELSSSSKEYAFLQETPSSSTPHLLKELPPDQYNFLWEEDQTLSLKKELSIQKETNLKQKLSAATYIGSFLKKYLFFESGTSLLVVDQHAAQERITYEQLLHQIESGRVETQHLLAPLIIKVSAGEMLVWELAKDKLEEAGFSTTLWDAENIALHAHPQLIKNPEIALRNLLGEGERSRFDMQTLARRACRNSLMAGYHISCQQAQYLLTELIKCKNPFVCPHGRPTVIELKEAIFEKQFLR
jgi:DNA mismatch repair protein MutL